MFKRNSKVLRRVIVTILVNFWFGLCLMAPERGWAGTALGDLAASMQPGTWAQVPNVGNMSALYDIGASGNILSYAMTSAWDPTCKQLHFTGEDHLPLHEHHLVWVYYDDATNAFVRVGTDPPQGPDSFSHAYDHLTIDTATRTLYQYGSVSTSNYDLYTYQLSNCANPYSSSTSWVKHTSITTGWQVGFVGTNWFPGVGHVDFNCGEPNGEITIWDTGGNWTNYDGWANNQSGGYQCFAEYSPKYNVLVFGGPSLATTKVWRLNSDKTITQLTDSPVPLGVQRANVVNDPATGNFIVWGGTSQLWELDPRGSGTWRQLSNLPPSAVGDPTTTGNLASLFSGSITNYGVIMYVTCRGQTCNVHLYKHAAGSGTPPPPADTTRPTVSITAPVAGATASGTINVTASASDNVGVAGVQFKLDGNNLGAEDTASPYSISWNTTLAANGSHALSAVARDAAGNTVASAAVSVTVSNAAPPPPPPPSGAQTFDQKCSQAGVISCFGFNSASATRTFPSSGEPLKYTWFTPNACDSAGLGTRYYLTSARSSAEGNAYALDWSGTCFYPHIDTAVTHSGAGSLRIDVPAVSAGAESGGYFTVPFKGVDLPQTFIGVPNGGSSCVSPANCEVWMQWYQMMDAGMLSQAFNASGGGEVAGTKQMIFVGNAPGATGDFSYNAVVLNSWLRGAPSYYWHNPTTLYGTPPGEVQNKAGVSSQFPNGCVYGFQANATSSFESTSIYNKGLSGFTQPPCVTYKANQWQEYTWHMKIVGASNAPLSLIELYVDGQLVAQNTTANIDWAGITGNEAAYPNCNRTDGAPGCGYGQFYLSVQMTNKGSGCSIGGVNIACPNTGAWFDDVVISTQPIAMGTTGSSTTSIPATPSGLTLH